MKIYNRIEDLSHLLFSFFLQNPSNLKITLCFGLFVMLYYPDYFDEAEYIMKARGFAHLFIFMRQ